LSHLLYDAGIDKVLVDLYWETKNGNGPY